MRITLEEIMFDGLHLDQQEIEVPTDITGVKEWLDDYGMHYRNDADARNVYIRTRLFQTFDMSFTFGQLTNTSIDLNKSQRYAVDIFDERYPSYETVQVKFDWPETLDIVITEDEIQASNNAYGDDADEMWLAAHDHLCHYLPLSIKIV
jgi:hypothetical protein